MGRARERLKPSIPAGSSSVIGVFEIESYADRQKLVLSTLTGGWRGPLVHQARFARVSKNSALNLTNSRARQLVLQLGDQLRYWLAHRSGRDPSTVFEDSAPVADRVLVHRSSAPAPCAADGGN